MRASSVLGKTKAIQILLSKEKENKFCVPTKVGNDEKIKVYLSHRVLERKVKYVGVTGSKRD